MTQPKQITVYVRHGRLLVSPSILTPAGFRSLPGAIIVPDRGSLATSIASAFAEIEAALARPEDQRFDPGRPLHLAAGASSWKEFVADATSVTVRRTATATRLQLYEPDETAQLVATRDAHELPPDAELSSIADAVLELLDGAVS